MLEDSLYTILTDNIDIPIVPVGPSSSNELDLTAQPIPSIVYLRHSTTPQLDLSGTVQCETVDMEVVILGNTFQESTYYAGLVKNLLNNATVDGYEWTFFNEMTITTSFAIAQYWSVFYTGID